MIVENGKRYVRADGGITGVIEDGGDNTYQHRDPDRGCSYTKSGAYCYGQVSARLDLVSEYIEPSPQYGPWIPWAGGECPVAKGAMGQVQFAWSTRVYTAALSPGPLAKLRWPIDLTPGDIIYYRVLIEEPEAVESTALVHTEPGRDWQQARLAIVTVQGDKLGIEWAPKGSEQ